MILTWFWPSQTSTWRIWASGRLWHAAQYKSILPFYYTSRISNTEWAIIFCCLIRLTGGPCDACGGVCRTAVNHSVLVEGGGGTKWRGIVPSFGSELPPSRPQGSCHKYRQLFTQEVIFLSGKDIRRWQVFIIHSTVPGTLQIHQVQGLTNRSIFTRSLACFCNHCCGLNG